MYHCVSIGPVAMGEIPKILRTIPHIGAATGIVIEPSGRTCRSLRPGCNLEILPNEKCSSGLRAFAAAHAAAKAQAHLLLMLDGVATT